MTKIVYNACFGGFGLSKKAIARYTELSGISEFNVYVLSRTDPFLVQVVEELGEKVNTAFSHLLICELPAGTKYRIDEYDGNERVFTIDDYEWEIA